MTASGMRPGLGLALAILLALGVSQAGCRSGSTTMSLDEARQVAASFAGTGYTPPPRTTQDVIGLAEGAWPTYLSIVADTWIHETGDAADLGKRYHLRGKAARQIGRFAQAVEDLTRAAGYLPPGSGVPDDLPGTADRGQAIQRDLAETLATSGNHRQAIEQYERAIRHVQGDRGSMFELLAGLVQVHADVGDVEGADWTLAELRLLASEIGTWGPSPTPDIAAARTASVLRAEAAALDLRGRFAEAERRWRQAIAAIDAVTADRAREARVNLPEDTVHWLWERRDADSVRLARCLLRQGRLVEAEAEVRHALHARARRAGYIGHDHVGALTALARVLRAQGRYEEATALARAAAKIFEQGKASPASSPPVVRPRLELAALLTAQARWDEALAAFLRVRQDLRDDPLFDWLVASDPAYLMTLFRAGRFEEAAALAESALARTAALRRPDDRTARELRALAALASRSRAQTPGAHASLAAVRQALEALLARSADEEHLGTTVGEHDQRLRWIVGAYIDALLEEAGPATPGADVIAEAFRVADVVRGRVAQRALGAAAVRGATSASGLAELVRQEHEVAQHLGAALALLSSLADRPDLADAERGRIATLTSARQALAAEIARRVEREFPGFGRFVNPSPVAIDDVQAVLRPEESLIAIFAGDDRTYVWAIPARGTAAFAVAPLGQRALEQTVTALRTALDARARTLGDIPPFDVVAAHRLFTRLLAPVRPGWERADTLVIVADGALAQLPFATLPTRATVLEPEDRLLFSSYRAVPWLGRSHAIGTVPSASALVTLRDAALYEAARRVGGTDAARRPFIGFGDPLFSEEQRRAPSRGAAPSPPAPADARAVALLQRSVIRPAGAGAPARTLATLPPLPDTADEIRAIARTTGADAVRDVFLGGAANEQAVKTAALERYRVVAFATHGLVPGDLDGLAQPALALTAPEVANVAGDGLLTMQEVLELRLNADWVVLSACNTANAVGVGAEGLSGLGRAFFYAGARALLVTHWPVETTSARALTTGLFERAVGRPWVSRAGTLQDTMNTLIDDGVFVDPASGRAVFSYAHPIFWAPFALIGDGGH